ncbi:MAG: hypothetical protein ACODAA_08230 [Gemmatimonadota bacterium]
MGLLRGIGSLLVGFLLLPMLMRIALVAVGAVWPDLVGPAADTAAVGAAGVDGPAVDLPTPSGGFMALNLGLTFVMAAVSATVTAILAPEPPYLWVLLLGFLVFAGGLVFGIQQVGGPAPTWYLLALPLTSGVAIAVGGWAYLRRRDAAG